MTSKKTGWYNKNKLGYSVKHEAHRHALASRGIKTSLPKGAKTVSFSGSPTPNFDMVARRKKLTYDNFKDKNVLARYFIVKKLTDQELLEKIGRYDSNVKIRLEAINKINNQDFLEKRALNDDSKIVRVTIIRMLDSDMSQKTLKKIAKNDEYLYNRIEAIDNIKSQDFLKKVAVKDKYDIVRAFAIERINDIKFLKNLKNNISKEDTLSLREINEGIERLKSWN